MPMLSNTRFIYVMPSIDLVKKSHSDSFAISGLCPEEPENVLFGNRSQGFRSSICRHLYLALVKTLSNHQQLVRQQKCVVAIGFGLAALASSLYINRVGENQLIHLAFRQHPKSLVRTNRLDGHGHRPGKECNRLHDLDGTFCVFRLNHSNFTLRIKNPNRQCGFVKVNANKVQVTTDRNALVRKQVAA